MDELQQLAVMDAVYKELGKRIKTMRETVNEKAKALYVEQGSDRLRININGEDCGTLSMSFSKPIDGTFPQVNDAEQFVQWFRTEDGGLDALRRLIAVKPDLVLKAAIVDGELPDGCAMVERHEPGQMKTPVLRTKPKSIAKALGKELPQAVFGILEGGQ